MERVNTRKLIWSASLCAFAPVVGGALFVPFSTPMAWWSLAAGGAAAALAFGAFLEIAQASVGDHTRWKGVLPVIIPALALIALGALGAVCMDGLSQQALRPESFVAGILSGTIFSQVALIAMSRNFSPAIEPERR